MRMQNFALLYLTLVSSLAFGNIISLQSAKHAESFGKLTLTNLNTHFNSSYLLEVKEESATKTFHIQSISFEKINLAKEPPHDLVFADTTRCTIEEAMKHTNDASHISVCNNRLYIRNRLPARESTKEWAVRVLRENIWGGEQITSFVKDIFYKDSHLITPDIQIAQLSTPSIQLPKNAIMLVADSTGLAPKDLGIVIDNEKTVLTAGSWYRSRNVEGIAVSATLPRLHPKLKGVRDLDTTESNALTYLVAIDLSKYRSNFLLGTEHPGVEWSDRYDGEKKNGGPDGFAKIDPLITTGRVPPHHRAHVSFTGGFKRNHGAFKWGQLAKINKGSHYGFIEDGIVYSTLQSGLATVLIDRQGELSMQTHSEPFNQAQVYSARQNGVPIVETKDGEIIASHLVNDWSQGNWSGSQQAVERALRAGICLQESSTGRHLIYGYFSSVTAKAMAQVFAAYGCSYAFHLDMNALEHTYLAIYHYNNNEIKIEHLITGMNVLDVVQNNKIIPRFLGVADNRDFFYFTSK
jgi:hypothetical protein